MASLNIGENQIIPFYGNLIHYAIHKYYPYRYDVEYEDLFQIGSIALLKAYRAYNPDKGMRFTNYALLKIQSALYDTIRKKTAQMRRGRAVSLDSTLLNTDFCLIDTIADEKADQEFDRVLIKICIEEGSYTMTTTPARKRTKATPVPETPVTTSLDLSNFIVFNAFNSTVSRDSAMIGVTRSGKVTLSSPIGAKYTVGAKLEVLVNQPATIIVIRQSNNGINCRPNGRNTAGKLIACKALTNMLMKKKIELPIRFRAEWDERVQGFVGKR